MKRDKSFFGSGWYSQPNWVVDKHPIGDPEKPVTFLDKHERLILSCMFRRAGNDGTCRPSKERIADDTGLSSKTVQRTIPKLEEKHLIEVHSVPGHPNTYSIDMSTIRAWGKRFEAEMDALKASKKGGLTDPPRDKTEGEAGLTVPAGRTDCPEGEDSQSPEVQQQQVQPNEVQQQGDVVAAMIDIGVEEKTAIKLWKTYSEKLIYKQIENLKRKCQVKKPKIPAGWLIDAIKYDYSLIKINKDKTRLSISRLIVYERAEDEDLYPDHGTPIIQDKGEHPDLYFSTKYIEHFIPYDKVKTIEDVKNGELYFTIKPDTKNKYTLPVPCGHAEFIDGIKTVKEIKNGRRNEQEGKIPAQRDCC